MPLSADPGALEGFATLQAMAHSRTPSQSPTRRSAAADAGAAKACSAPPPRPRQRPVTAVSDAPSPRAGARRRPASALVVRSQPSQATLASNLFAQDAAIGAAAGAGVVRAAWASGNVAGTGAMLGPSYQLLRPEGPVDIPRGREGAYYLVHPSRGVSPPPRPARVPGTTDNHLPEATFHVQCRDRITGAPVAGATVIVVNLRSFMDGKVVNAGSTCTKSTKTDSHGRTRCRVLASHRYVLLALCTGYHPFGDMGERVIVSAEDFEHSHVCLPLVPVRVGIIVTVKELVPYNEDFFRDWRARTLEQQGGAKGDLGTLGEDLRRATVLLRDPVTGEEHRFLAVPVHREKLVDVSHAVSGHHVGTFSTDWMGNICFSSAEKQIGAHSAYQSTQQERTEALSHLGARPAWMPSTKSPASLTPYIREIWIPPPDPTTRPWSGCKPPSKYLTQDYKHTQEWQDFLHANIFSHAAPVGDSVKGRGCNSPGTNSPEGADLLQAVSTNPYIAPMTPEASDMHEARICLPRATDAQPPRAASGGPFDRAPRVHALEAGQTVRGPPTSHEADVTRAWRGDVAIEHNAPDTSPRPRQLGYPQHPPGSSGEHWLSTYGDELRRKDAAELHGAERADQPVWRPRSAQATRLGGAPSGAVATRPISAQPRLSPEHARTPMYESSEYDMATLVRDMSDVEVATRSMQQPTVRTPAHFAHPDAWHIAGAPAQAAQGGTGVAALPPNLPDAREFETAGASDREDFLLARLAESAPEDEGQAPEYGDVRRRASVMARVERVDALLQAALPLQRHLAATGRARADLEDVVIESPRPSRRDEAPESLFLGAVMSADTPLVDGATAATLPTGVYQAMINDKRLKVLFVATRREGASQRCYPSEHEVVEFRVAPTPASHRPGANRYNYLPHSHFVRDIYTDNTARAFVSRGGAASRYTTYEIYTRLRPRVQISVREVHPESEHAGRLASADAFMFSINDVYGDQNVLIDDEDPDIKLANALLSKSRHSGPQQKLWIAHEIARMRRGGGAAFGAATRRSDGGAAVTVDATRSAEIGADGSSNSVVRELNALTKRINEGGKEVFAPAAAQNVVTLVPRYSGRLDGAYLQGTHDLSDMWVECGQLVAAVVTAHHPYVEWRQRAFRAHFWRQAPYVFPALKKVRVRFGVRAMWSQAPVPGVRIVVDLMHVPRPPPPEPLGWEWCECTASYCQRVLAQLIDFVVENAEPEVVANMAEHHDLSTDEHGLAEVWMPPGAVASVHCLPLGQESPGDGVAADVAAPGRVFEAVEAQRKVTVSYRSQQLVGFELHQMARVRVVVREFGVGTPVAGAVVRFVMSEDENGELRDEVVDERVVTEDGHTGWVTCRAGTLLRAELVSQPPNYLSMDFMDRMVEQPRAVRLRDEHEMVWELPHKPRIAVRAHDAASGENVYGVQYRVMIRRHAPRAAPAHVKFSDRHTQSGLDSPAFEDELRRGRYRDPRPSDMMADRAGVPLEVRSAFHEAHLPLQDEPAPMFTHMSFRPAAHHNGTDGGLATAQLTAPCLDQSLSDASDGEDDASVGGCSVRSMWRPGARVHKSQLKARSERRERLKTATDRWSDVETWNGDFNDLASETWGEVIYESYTGMDHDTPLLVDVGVDVTVQMFPVYPFLQRSILQKRPIFDMRGCPTFVLWLPRDLNAHLFWKRRDLLAPYFWDAQGDPVFPPPPMARLQPMPASSQLLAPFDVAIRALRPNWTQPDPEIAVELRAKGWAMLDETGSESQAGIWQKLEAAMRAQGGVVDPKDSEISRGIFDELPPWKILMLIEEQMREDEAALLQTNGRRRSADQYVDSMKMQLMFGVMVRAMQYLKLADTSRIPVERTGLKDLLYKWGAFKHVGDGPCRGCGEPRGAEGGRSKDDGDAGIIMEPPLLESKVLKIRNVEIDLEKVACNAKWVLSQHWRGSQAKQDHLKHADKRAAPPSQRALYCRGPFFTWATADGTGTHVGVHTGLYVDLITLMKSLEESIKVVSTQLERIRTYNATRVKEGRFLFGHGNVDEGRGGVFVLDASSAQPHGSAEFMVQQLTQMLEFWAEQDRSGEQLQMAFLISAGDELVHWRLGVREVKSGMATGMVRWFKDQAERFYAHRGFDIAQALRAAMALSGGRLPIYLMCGALQPTVASYDAGTAGANATDAILSQISDVQQTVARKQERIQPIHTIEMYPMPLLPKELQSRHASQAPPRKSTGGARRRAAARSRSASPSRAQSRSNLHSSNLAASRGPTASGGPALDYSLSKRDVPLAQVGSGDWSVLGKDDASGADTPRSGASGASASGDEHAAPADALPATYGANVFVRLAAEADRRKARLVDLFRSVDKNGKGWLSAVELYHFCRMIVPDISPGQLRYLEVMLDHDGDGRVSYTDVQHLATMSKRTGLAFLVKSNLDATDVLKCAAVFMFDKRLTIAEFYQRFDDKKTARLDARSIATVLHVVMKATSRHERKRLIQEFIQVFDVDGDGFISPEEFQRAMEIGEPMLPTLENDWAAMDMRTDFQGQGRGLTSNSLARLGAEHAVMRKVEANGQPLTSLLQQISSLTGGRSRKLDMGSAKAAAQHINPADMDALLGRLRGELEACQQFEVAYAKRLNLERRVVSAGVEDSGDRGVSGTYRHVSSRVRGAPGAADADDAAPRSGPDPGPELPRARSAKKIPAIVRGSNLLKGTGARKQYFHAMLRHAEEVAAKANDVSTRSCGYPASGPGPIRPAATAWENLRQKEEKQKRRAAKRRERGAAPAPTSLPAGQRPQSARAAPTPPLVTEESSRRAAPVSAMRAPPSGAPMPRSSKAAYAGDEVAYIQGSLSPLRAAIAQREAELVAADLHEEGLLARRSNLADLRRRSSGGSTPSHASVMAGLSKLTEKL